MKAITENKPFYRKRRFLVGAIALALALAILVTAIVLALTAAPAVYGFGGATLREDVYSYWFSCMKYVYLVRYRDLGIEDSPEGWASASSDGRSFEEMFYELMDGEIRLRFVAASLFDSEGYALTKSDRAAVTALIEEFKGESFGEIPLDVLKKRYGASKRTVKQTALYEQKYKALYRELFSDATVIYSDQYKETLEEFYKTYYGRYNMIYLPDSVGGDVIEALEAALWQDGNAGVSAVTGVTEERFTALEKEYTDENHRVMSGNHPNGIYLYAGESYVNNFSAELLSAFAEANEIGKVVKKRNADDSGSYYVMRYALDEKPYLSSDERVTAGFKNLPNYAGAYLYRKLLRDELAKIVSHGIAEGHTVAGAFGCKEYNVVQLLGS
ncbi:MAG: hypothetical protein E7609_03315 [Ruminococcaceae bacterium]|nr:hypothetical protein [Oscillospiraceae bacterium]